MAEPHLARFRQTLKSAIQARQAETASARQVIYDAMDKALERSVAANPERYAAVDLASLRLGLKNAIVSVEDDYRDGCGIAANRDRRQRIRPYFRSQYRLIEHGNRLDRRVNGRSTGPPVVHYLERDAIFWNRWIPKSALI